MLRSSYPIAHSFSFTSATRLTIGNHVKSISKGCFENCSSLQSVTIPDSVMTINNYAFRGCTQLKGLIIADRNKTLSLGSNGSSPLFADCPLDSVYIGGSISYNTSSSYGYSPFYGNTKLRSVVITEKDTIISPNEFYGCTNLQNINIGDGVTEIGNRAFSGCTSLKTVSLGTQLKTIGQEAFSDCTAMTQIVSKAVAPPTCDVQALDDINKWDCTLFIPTGSLASYQAADQWKDFFFIKEGSENTGISRVMADDIQIRSGKGIIEITGISDGADISVYALSGQFISSAKAVGRRASLVTNLTKGNIAIVKIGTKSVKVIMQ